MLSASSTLAAAVTSPAQKVVTDAQVDLPRTGSWSDISPYISAWSFSRTLTTDVPDGARLVSGYAAAELSLTGVGDPLNNAHNGPWLWSPYNRGLGNVTPLTGASGRIGTPIRVHAGFNTSAGNEVLPRFTGTLRSIEVDGQQGTAALDALDGSDRMRTQANIPLMLGDYDTVQYSNLAVRQGLNGGRIIDFLFRANGFYSTPPPRTGCVLSVPTHGSLEPDHVVNPLDGTWVQYGSTLYAYDGPFSTLYSSSAGPQVVSYISDMGLDSRTGKAKAKFGQCVDPQQGMAAGWNMASNFTVSSGSTYTIEGWFDLSNPLGAASGTRLVTLGMITQPPASGGVQPTQTIEVGFMGDSRPFVRWGTGSTVFGTAVASGSRTWAYALINVAVNSSANTVTASFMLNSTAPTTGNGRVITTSANYSVPYTAIQFQMYGDIATGCLCRWEALQVTTEASGAAYAAPNLNFAPTAFIEPSLNSITTVPYTTDLTDSWQGVQEIASAEFGVVFFDESNVATFWNRNHITAQPSAVATVTADRQLTALTTSESVDSVKNHIVATITPYQVLPLQYVYNLGHTVGIHSGQTFTYTATFDNPVASLDTHPQYVPLGDTNNYSGYRACRTPDGTGAPVKNLIITVTPYAQTAQISIHNPNNFPVYMICPLNDENGNAFPTTSAGMPVLRLWGVPVVQALSPSTTASGSDVATTSTLEVKDTASMGLYGAQEYDLAQTNWLQLADSVQGIITDMLGQLAYPFPVLTNVTITADPRLQIGDRVRLQDSKGTQLDNDAYIVGIDESLDPTTGYTQTLTLRAIGGPRAWTLGDPVKGVLDDGYVLGGLW